MKLHDVCTMHKDEWAHMRIPMDLWFVMGLIEFRVSVSEDVVMSTGKSTNRAAG